MRFPKVRLQRCPQSPSASIFVSSSTRSSLSKSSPTQLSPTYRYSPSFIFCGHFATTHIHFHSTPPSSMASTDILSQTLSSITSIKLDEITHQRTNFEERKARLLQNVATRSDQRDRVGLLLNGIETDLPTMRNLKDHPALSLSNIRQFLTQARHDPSVTPQLLEDWQKKLEKELDIHSLKHEYASLYGRLVKEWLSASDGSASEGDSMEIDSTGFEKLGRKEMHEQRAKWENYVFKASDVDTVALRKYLETLFQSSKATSKAYQNLRDATQAFEVRMARNDHFDDETLRWVIQGLLGSDLVTDEKREVLQDFLNNKVVLAEVADVLNMRMASLDKWKWDAEGTPVEIRRQLNGRYRFYHDEDLLQSILLRYIGVVWSVHFKQTLTRFYAAEDVWKPSSTKVPHLNRQRRDFFLGYQGIISTVEKERAKHFADEVLLEQLTSEVGETRGGYNDDDHDSDVASASRKSGQQITQTLLHTLLTEILMATALHQSITVVRTDFAWFGPSLPHSTMFTVLKFFNASDKWINFFRTVLEAPMKSAADGPNAQVQIRKRGTPISGPLSDMLGETTLFCLDFAFNQLTDGARMYRLHDDIWFWGAEKTCVEGWAVMTEFANLTGLNFNNEKTGSVKIHGGAGEKAAVSNLLPKGDVVWGFLKLDANSGTFVIDQNKVDIHIKELRHQLDACKSVFDWIQAWNVYGARFFTTNFGKPANCWGPDHVEMLLSTFARIQAELFSSTGGSVTSTLQQMLTERFGVENIPEGYLYFPMSMGGLDLKNPFVNLNLLRDMTEFPPRIYLDSFLEHEEHEYRKAKLHFEDSCTIERMRGGQGLYDQFKDEDFMTFEEFTRYREQTSESLAVAYTSLKEEFTEKAIVKTPDVQKALDAQTWQKLSSYHKWIIQLYGSEMIKMFGGLHVADKGLLPVGMVSMYRESRFKWQG